MSTKIVWQPSQELLEDCQLTHYTQYVNIYYRQAIFNYHELHAWSIIHREQFWESIWHYFAIKHSKKFTRVLQNGDNIEQSRWFTGAKLNFAENLLSRRDDKLAIIFRNEQGARQTLSYKQLYHQTAQLAAALRDLGVRSGDCIAGFLPNIPEAIIAMLATTSLGAIWSSCSPEFGFDSVIDRIGQIKPKVLFAADGQMYNGQAHDLREKIAQLSLQLPTLTKVIMIPYLNQQCDVSAIPKAELLTDFCEDYRNFDLGFSQENFDHPVYILYSSGTTGAPKCMVHGAGGTLLQHLKELRLHCNVQENDIITYYTTTGWMMWNWLVSSLAIGATIVLYDGAAMYPQASRLFDIIDEEKITYFGTSTKYLIACEKAHLQPIDTHNLSHLKSILATGSPLLPSNFYYTYTSIKNNVALCSISGDSDIISCFALSCPTRPIHVGQLQCRGLGMDVSVYNQAGEEMINKKGELVCRQSFPSMPVFFYNDPDGQKYHQAYFAKYPNVWAHGDYARLTLEDGVEIYGRSDTVLNPSGIRIGTAEIYRQVEKFDGILESLVIGQEYQAEVYILLFVKLRENITLDDLFKERIKREIKQNASARHVPTKIIAVPDIPRSISGKIVEIAVKNIVEGKPVDNEAALANPEALAYFKGQGIKNS